MVDVVVPEPAAETTLGAYQAKASYVSHDPGCEESLSREQHPCFM